MRRGACAATIAVALALTNVPLRAHHSHAMFDMTKEVTVTGMVTSYLAVKVNPLRDGRLGGNYTSVTAADGKTYQ